MGDQMTTADQCLLLWMDTSLRNVLSNDGAYDIPPGQEVELVVEALGAA